MTKKIEVFASEALPGELEDFPDIKRGWGTTKESTGGIPPMKWFNAVQKRTDEWLLYLTQRGIPEWDASLDYPKSAVVTHSDVIYISVRESKGEQPNTTQAAWSELSAFLGIGNYYTKVESDANFQPKGDYAINAALESKFDKTAVVQTTGTSTTQVISQNGVSKALASKADSKVFIAETDIGNSAISPPGGSGSFVINKNGGFYVVAPPPSSRHVFKVNADGLLESGVVPYSNVSGAPLLGVGQKWKTVTKQINTLYTNATQKPIFVFAKSNDSSNNFKIELEVDGVIASSIMVNGTGGKEATTTKELSCGAIVPSQSSYKFLVGGVQPSGISISYAAELS